jgi:uncharacterized protein (DUF1800 family)
MCHCGYYGSIVEVPTKKRREFNNFRTLFLYAGGINFVKRWYASCGGIESLATLDTQIDAALGERLIFFVKGGYMTSRFSNQSMRARAQRGLRFGFLSLVLANAPFVASAQTCPFDVSRDVVANPTPRTPSLALDGALLTRFSLGLRGTALYDKLSTDSMRFVGEGNTGSLLAQLDIDGDGVFTTTDSTIAARYVAGFRNDALTAGLTFNTVASRKTGAQVTTYISGGCVVTAATATPQRHAARLLQQGTYGATLNEINRVAGLGANPNAMTNAWLTEQFAKTRSPFASYAQQIMTENKDPNNTGAFHYRCNQSSEPPQDRNGCPWAANTPTFYRAALTREDQLRQRVTNALWQTLVVSISNNTVLDAGDALPSYWDMLSENVFGGNTVNAAGQSTDAASGLAVGNFRKILKDMTLHPAMGIFLDMLGSTAEVPNENYPRELLQLFSVGTVMLNQDGSPQLVNGKTVPTYNEDIVKSFSKALTGWHFAGADSDPTKAWWFYWYPNRDHTLAMQPWSLRRCPQNGRWPPGTADNAPNSNDPAICYSYCNVTNAACSFPPPHNREAKTLLSYTQLNNQPAPHSMLAANPAPTYAANKNHTDQDVRNNVRAAALDDLEKLIDNVFYHPNVGPFISRQLIQRLVTSNPTPGYISRVAAVFNDSNGGAAGGTRGDMREVVKAIFLDNEARDVNIAAKPWFGKLREPVNKFVHLHRAFGATASGGYYDIWDTSGPETLGQSAMKPPSVFNYYSPDFGPSGPATYTQTRPNSDLGARAAEPLYAPEFEITSTSSIAGFSDFWGWGVYRGFNRYNSNQALNWRPDYSRYITGTGALADNSQAMIEELDLLLTAGNLKPAFKANLVAMANGITRSNVDEQREQRFQAVFWQIVNSADYAIQR